jgi:hypothetical protein
MWILKRGQLVSPNRIELTYIHKDQLIALDTQGTCQSLEIFCPDTVPISNLPWQKFQTIKTKDWILRIIKLNGVARTLLKPIVLADITTVEELYHQIVQSDRAQSDAPCHCQTSIHKTTTTDDATQLIER